MPLLGFLRLLCENIRLICVCSVVKIGGSWVACAFRFLDYCTFQRSILVTEARFRESFISKARGGGRICVGLTRCKLFFLDNDLFVHSAELNSFWKEFGARLFLCPNLTYVSHLLGLKRLAPFSQLDVRPISCPIVCSPLVWFLSSLRLFTLFSPIYW